METCCFCGRRYYTEVLLRHLEECAFNFKLDEKQAMRFWDHNKRTNSFYSDSNRVLFFNQYKEKFDNYQTSLLSIEQSELEIARFLAFNADNSANVFSGDGDIKIPPEEWNPVHTSLNNEKGSKKNSNHSNTHTAAYEEIPQTTEIGAESSSFESLPNEATAEPLLRIEMVDQSSTEKTKKDRRLFIPTALSTTTACFICRDKNGTRHRLKKNDIVYAYIHHGIYIKKNTRSCNSHLQDNGLLRREEFAKIPTKKMQIKSDAMELLKIISSTCKDSIFEPFRKVKYLDDKDCVAVTGWPKTTFIEFCNSIKTIKNNRHRTKEQLVALYRYWLRTGIDQKSLAALFSNKTRQNRISDYLSQIRVAIHTEIVPKYLGAQRKREDFLKFNTKMTQNIFNIDDDVLVVVADGTYCSIEKSGNNQFQYDTYSSHKKDSLFKPFILCCADGYIIECYGPFSAPMNDAKIFRYILDTDTDLVELLVADKTLILIDRGFRTVFDFLENQHLNPKIPCCRILEEKGQLTTKEANETRLVTKCRFIVERKIGEIKRHAALDNRRNREVGHLQIDYRNTCAMINFTHKPCCADNLRSPEKFAERMRQQSQQDQNILGGFLSLELDAFDGVALEEIRDFPKISKEKLVSKIFMGTYNLKGSKRYLSELLKVNLVFMIDPIKLKAQKKHLHVPDNTRIIGLLLSSRHMRSKRQPTIDPRSHHEGLNYVLEFKTSRKIIIMYTPNENKYKSVQAYVCTCRVGKRTTGCCIHVATVVYYLAFGKYQEDVSPGEYLNSVLVDLSKLDSPKKPKYVRPTRRNVKPIDLECDSDSSED